MTTWSLTQLLTGLHDDIEQRLSTARKSFAHAPTKGDASEHVWRDLLEKYLPKRYQTATAHIVDSKGAFSDQIDLVIFDRQYSPLIFKYEGQTIIPAESVYTVFECKQTINAALVSYAAGKVASVRKLHRTSLPIPHAGGRFDAKVPGPILGGILSFESSWKPAMGDPLRAALLQLEQVYLLDIGCIAANGIFHRVDSTDRRNTLSF